MTLLKDDGESVQTAVKTSFDLLTKAEQDALVLMSVFPGSFDCDAAEAVIREHLDPGSLPVAILRSLKNRSLVEQPRSRRYQLHPLIRAFAKEIGHSKSEPSLLDGGEKLACAHFMSRFDSNAKIFWSKDSCKESIESFNEDRQNFEHFLTVFSQGMENQDQKIANDCKTFLEDFPQKCMYLEKCVQPKFYTQFLERLLSSYNPEVQPVHTVELLCLLGHEMRKIRENEKYNDYMAKAIHLCSEKKAEFETKALSEVIYLHSYARFLSAKKGFDKPKKAYKNVLKICKEKIPGHPETAATLLFAGRYAKRRKEKDEAEDMLMQALDLFTKLGDHFMTAQCLKDIADFLFLVDKTDSHLDKPLSLYREAMEMMEKLGVSNQKESILTLKNYGVCHMKNGNFEEATSLLQRAESVAERELEKDHMWKVMVKTQLAIVHYKLASAREMEPPMKQLVLDKMEALMKEGLDMSYRLVGSRTIDHLGNKDLIRNVLNHYPERFPEKQYPRR